MALSPIPRQGQAFVGQNGLATQPFYLWLSALDGAVRTLIAEDAGGGGSFLAATTQVQGIVSVVSIGTLAGGVVQLRLQNDAAAPGNTTAYGTDGAGAKGWFPIADALAAGATMALTAGTDGVTTFEQAVLADTGVGAALVKITRDGYGRVEGTEAADTDDLAEGATNLYFTDARAVAALEDTGPDYLQLLLDEYNP